jgi:hypothetical protein
MQLNITITGIAPMLQHNGRLANPLDPYTRQIAGISGKRKKTDEDRYDLMKIEARGGCWETTDGTLGIPNEAVWRSIYDAAKAYKRGEDIKRALLIDPDTVPLLIDGDVVDCDIFLKDPEHIDYRPVKIMGKKTMRARPLIPAGWQSTHTAEILEDVIDLGDMAPIFERAGRLVGIGDWRPRYGRFEIGVV